MDIILGNDIPAQTYYTSFSRNRHSFDKDFPKMDLSFILIPGTGGSNLEVKLDGKDVPNRWCPKNTVTFKPLWLIPLHDLFSPFLECWTTSMELIYNKTLNTFTAPQGVEVRAKDFGLTKSIEYLSNGIVSVGYFNKFVEKLTEFGYIRDLNILAAPYDFRYPVNSKWIEKTRLLIEHQVSKPVLKLENIIQKKTASFVIVSHSMGCLYTLKFLSLMTKEWLDEHVLHWVAVGCPFAGVVDSMLIYASGDNRGVPIVPSLKLRKEQRSGFSNLWMLPNEDYFQNSNDVWLEVKSGSGKSIKQYRVNDLNSFLNDVGFPEGVSLLHDLRQVLKEPLQAGPFVPTTCIFSVGVKTRRNLTYLETKTGNWNDKKPNSIHFDDNGDGIVGKESISVCENWIRSNTTDVALFVLSEKIDHMELLNSPKVHSIIQRIIGK